MNNTREWSAVWAFYSVKNGHYPSLHCCVNGEGEIYSGTSWVFLQRPTSYYINPRTFVPGVDGFRQQLREYPFPRGHDYFHPR